ncbi:MAG: hypothetical protein AAGG72_07575 [Pseudomonadota bacterium]
MRRDHRYDYAARMCVAALLVMAVGGGAPLLAELEEAADETVAVIYGQRITASDLQAKPPMAQPFSPEEALAVRLIREMNRQRCEQPDLATNPGYVDATRVAVVRETAEAPDAEQADLKRALAWLADRDVYRRYGGGELRRLRTFEWPVPVAAYRRCLEAEQAAWRVRFSGKQQLQQALDGFASLSQWPVAIGPDANFKEAPPWMRFVPDAIDAREDMRVYQQRLNRLFRRGATRRSCGSGGCR